MLLATLVVGGVWVELIVCTEREEKGDDAHAQLVGDGLVLLAHYIVLVL